MLSPRLVLLAAALAAAVAIPARAESFAAIAETQPPARVITAEAPSGVPTPPASRPGDISSPRPDSNAAPEALRAPPRTASVVAPKAESAARPGAIHAAREKALQRAARLRALKRALARRDRALKQVAALAAPLAPRQSHEAASSAGGGCRSLSCPGFIVVGVGF